jgi:hypothetical protein
LQNSYPSPICPALSNSLGLHFTCSTLQHTSSAETKQWKDREKSKKNPPLSLGSQLSNKEESSSFSDLALAPLLLPLLLLVENCFRAGI